MLRLGEEDARASRNEHGTLSSAALSITFWDMYKGSAYQDGVKVLLDLWWVVEDIILGEIRRRVARSHHRLEPGSHQVPTRRKP
jgi:hypothetical protein